LAVTGSLARAARALVQLPRDHVARLAALDANALADFEAGRTDLDEDAKARLRHALEESGALFLPEEDAGGVGVRLKFTAKDVRAINRLEGEGGPVGEDDV
jgi:hypothetical protein